MQELFKDTRTNASLRDALLLWQLSKPYYLRLLLALLCSAVLSAINGAIAWSVKPAVDTAFSDTSSVSPYLLPLGVFLLFVLRGLFAFANNFLMSSIGAKLVKNIRQALFEKLLSLPVSYFANNSSANVLSKILNDIGTLHSAVAYTIKDFIVETATVIVLAGVAFYRRWDLALLCFIVIPAIAYSIESFGKRMKKTSSLTRTLIADITKVAQESIQGIRIIKAFTMQSFFSQRHDAVNTEHYRNTMRETRINEWASALSDIFAGIGVAIIVYYGGYLIISKAMTPGDFFSFITAVLLMFTPLKRLSRVNNNFQIARTVLDRLREVFLIGSERLGGEAIANAGDVRLENVTFRYPNSDKDALKNISLHIKQGQSVAFVGYSGAGKSTLVDLILGFWQVQSGKIYIDGKDINTIDLNQYRLKVGYVSQDVFLFDDTVWANIKAGKPDATEQEVIEASKLAYAHEFIMDLPQGYDTIIGERGVRLSGGQKQRLTIARAILRNPQLLVFDEATSSLDTDSEQKVQLAIDSLIAGRSTIIIAHRLSTIKRVKTIYVLSSGEIVQAGSYDELLSQDGIFKQLHRLQSLDKTTKIQSEVS